jgi:hypothetical protein
MDFRFAIDACMPQAGYSIARAGQRLNGFSIVD